jgi:hypothetical protein
VGVIEKEGVTAELTLVSPLERRLRPRVEAATQNALRFLAAGIRRTEQRLRAFEEQYGRATAEFLAQYENDQLKETLDFDEWIGEWRMLERLQDHAATLRGIEFANGSLLSTGSWDDRLAPTTRSTRIGTAST